MTTPDSPSYALVADLGGTHNRWQLIDLARGRTAPLETVVARNDAFPSFAAALVAARAALPEVPLTQVVVAAAGPVAGDRVTLTNRPDWVIDAQHLTEKLGAPVRLVNDFAAQAYGLLTVTPEECERLDQRDPTRPLPGERLDPLERALPLAGERPLAVIGPGTGLGIAFLWQPSEQKPLVLASEAGNLRLPPCPAIAPFWERLAADAPHRQPYWEWLLSGPGLARYHRLRTGGTSPTTSEAIFSAAQQGNREATATVEGFSELLAAFAAEAVLMAWATAGVVLVGSLANALAPWLRRPAWHAAFADTPRYRQELAATPRWLIHATDLGLRGAAWLAAQASRLDQRAEVGPR